MRLRKLFAITLCLVLACLSLSACGSVKIPLIANTDETTAKNLLSANGLIPAIKYENSEDVAKGFVIKTEPDIESSVEKNSVVTIFISEGPELTVPDVEEIDAATAKDILSSNSLIPNVVYEYDNWVEQGCIIKTDPTIGSKIEPNSKVTLYVSKGPSYIESLDSRITWWNVADGDDMWEFFSPYIVRDKLYINCYNVVLAARVKWLDRYSNGKLIGIASVNDTYDKSVPLSAKYTKQEWAANEAQSFTLEIPLNDLDVEKPTSLYIKLFADINDISKDIEISFTISW